VSGVKIVAEHQVLSIAALIEMGCAAERRGLSSNTPLLRIIPSEMGCCEAEQ